MSARWKWSLALLAAMLVSSSPALSDDEPGTVNREGGTGWKGIPGAKDPGEPGQSPGWTEQALKLVPVEQEWAFRTPHDSDMMRVGALHRKGAWVDVSNGILPIKGVGGGAMRFQLGTGVIMLDLGNGKYDTQLTGELRATRIKTPDGTEAPYVFRLRRDHNEFLFMRACMVAGKIDDVPVAFIDENNNGVYGDADDAVHVGNAPAAQNYSGLLNVKNKIYYVKVDQAGTKLWTKPYDGPTGKVDLASHYKGKAKPIFVALQQGDMIMEASAKDTVLPEGTWSIVDGIIGPTIYQSTRIKAGRSKPIEVKKDDTASLAWGMPGIIEFSCTKEGNQLHISTGTITMFGQGGEQYSDFRPKKFTPNVIAAEETGKRVVYEGSLGAGC